MHSLSRRTADRSHRQRPHSSRAARAVAPLVVAALAVTACGAPPPIPRSSCSAGYVALTYDDGPSEFTSDVADKLEEYRLTATFFLVGSQVEEDPDTVDDLAADFPIGNHTYNHEHLPLLEPAEQEREITETTEAIASAADVTPRLFRSPFGETTPKIDALVTSLGMEQTLWTLDTNDWKGRTAEEIDSTVATAVAGDIILMHDNDDADLEAIPMMAETLASKDLCTGHIAPSARRSPAFAQESHAVRVVAP